MPNSIHPSAAWTLLVRRSTIFESSADFTMRVFVTELCGCASAFSCFLSQETESQSACETITEIHVVLWLVSESFTTKRSERQLQEMFFWARFIMRRKMLLIAPLNFGFLSHYTDVFFCLYLLEATQIKKILAVLFLSWGAEKWQVFRAKLVVFSNRECATDHFTLSFSHFLPQEGWAVWSPRWAVVWGTLWRGKHHSRLQNLISAMWATPPPKQNLAE